MPIPQALLRDETEESPPKSGICEKRKNQAQGAREKAQGKKESHLHIPLSFILEP